jgi:hypothetical protein
MQQPPVQPFDDPALKAALRRALDSSEAAPVGLRERLRAGGFTDTAVASDAPIPMPRRSPVYRFAAAAVILIGFSMLAYRVWDMQRGPTYPSNPTYAVPNSLYKAMIDTHQARLTGGATPADTVKSLEAAASLSATTGRATFVADLTRDGWVFQGGAVREVGAHQGVQLFFTKEKGAISVFSLPASAAPQAREGTTYDTSFNGTPIAGFTRRGGLYCIVGSSVDGSLDVADVKNLLERHQGEVARG